MPGILEGYRVVDWTMFHLGPQAAGMLADLGADVIHVEPLGGDAMRGFHTYGLSPYRDGRHIHFENFNRNKRSIAVDLKSAEGREVLYRLVESADVFMSNLRLDAAERLGMDAESLRARNPNLIYGHASAFGTEGPDAHMPSLDSIGMARSGLMSATGFEGDPPTPPATGVGDRITGILFAYGLLGALLARERFGTVQDVSTSMLAANMELHGGWTLAAALQLGAEYPRHSRPGLSNGGRSTLFECSDDRWINLMVTRDEQWQQFCEITGCDLNRDERFATMAAAIEHRAEWDAALAAFLRTQPATHWQRLIREAGNKILFSIVNRLDEVADDEQVKANDMIFKWDHPAWGPVDWINFPVQWSETPAELRSPAPELGEHTEAVLLEIGYSWDEIGQLKDGGVIL